MSTAKDPFPGTWHLDPASLEYSVGRPGKRAVYTIEAVPGGLMFFLDADDADGKPMKVQYGGPLDGIPKPLPGGDGTLQLVLKRESVHRVESVLLRAGQVVDRWTREISPDGQVMTIVQHVRTADGRELQNRGIYRRVPR